ncbi:MAG: paraquat-inducible protein A, partial [Lacunisphaera sp.]
MNATGPCPACRRELPAKPSPAACPHCAMPLSHRRNGGQARSAAFGLAALIMLVPAYALPVLSIQNLGRAQEDTIFSGVWKLWQDGMWGVALIVFTASLLVPALKLSGLAVLLAASRWPQRFASPALARLYRIIHVIGRWSMLDVFLVAFLCGIVRFGGLATVVARPGAAAFATVVILTILATAAYDPRALRAFSAPSSS